MFFEGSRTHCCRDWYLSEPRSSPCSRLTRKLGGTTTAKAIITHIQILRRKVKKDDAPGTPASTPNGKKRGATTDSPATPRKRAKVSKVKREKSESDTEDDVPITADGSPRSSGRISKATLKKQLLDLGAVDDEEGMAKLKEELASADNEEDSEYVEAESSRVGVVELN